MGDEDRCDSDFFLDLPQLQLHLHTKLLVERAEAFIQEEKLWLEHERASQSHALLLAAGQFRGTPGRKAVEPDHVQRFVDGFGDLATAEPALLQAERNVLTHRHVREQGVALEDHADVSAMSGQVCDLSTIDRDAPRVWLAEAGGESEGCRFPGSGRAGK